jgi:hypothetical protein
MQAENLPTEDSKKSSNSRTLYLSNKRQGKGKLIFGIPIWKV